MKAPSSDSKVTTKDKPKVTGRASVGSTTKTTSSPKEATTPKTKSSKEESHSNTSSVNTTPNPTPPASRKNSITGAPLITAITTNEPIDIPITNTTTQSAVTNDDNNNNNNNNNGMTNANNLRSESVDKLMRALKELNDFKIKAQETIKGLQLKLKEVTSENERINKDKGLDNDLFVKEKEKLRKEYEKEQVKLNKEIEKIKEEQEEEINKLNETIEMLTLDREIAEEKAESLEQECEQLKAKLNIFELEQENKTVSNNTNNNENEEREEEQDVEKLMEQNEKLKEALLKIRDLTLAEKQEKEKRIKDLEREVKVIPTLQDKINKLENELREATATLEELTEALDASAEAEQMVEELTEKNLNLEEQIKVLNNTVEELEQLRDIADEIEENQNAAEKQLRSELYAKEIELLDQATVITNLKNTILEKDRNVDQFRTLTRTLQEQLNLIKQREEETLSQANELTSQSQQLLNKNLQLQTKILKASAITIEQELSTINKHEGDIYIQFVKDYLPKSTLSNDLDTIYFILLFKRFFIKFQIILNYLDRFQLNNNGDNITIYSSIDLIYYWKLKNKIQHLLYSTTDFYNFIQTTDVDTYLKLGSYYFELVNYEPKIDYLISLIKEEELTPSYDIQSLDEFINKLNHLFANLGGNNAINNNNKTMQRDIQDIIYECNNILVQEPILIELLNSKLTKTEENNNNENNIITIGPMKRIRHCIELCRKINKTMNEYTPLTDDQPIILNKFEVIHQIIQKIFSLLSEFTQMTQTTIDNYQDITRTQLLDTYRSLLKQRFQDEEETWSWLDELTNTIYNNLTGISESFNNGKPVVNTTITNNNVPIELDKLKFNSYVTRAESVRSIISDAGSLKDKIEEKNQEIIELKKQNQIKVNEMQEQQWKELTLEKKIEKLQKLEEKLSSNLAEEMTKRQEQEKMYSEALDSIQKDVDRLSAENRSLKEKTVKMDSNSSNLMRETRERTDSYGDLIDSNRNSAGSTVSSHEVNSLRVSIKYLREQIIKLKNEKSMKVLEQELPPLAGTTYKQNNITLLDSLTDKNNNLLQHNKQMQQLSMELHTKLAGIQVINLNNKQNGSSVAQFTANQQQLSDLNNKLIQLKLDSQHLTTNEKGQPSYQFTQFPVNASKEIKYLGKINIPSSPSNQTSRLLVDHSQFTKLHTLFAHV